MYSMYMYVQQYQVVHTQVHTLQVVGTYMYYSTVHIHQLSNCRTEESVGAVLFSRYLHVGTRLKVCRYLGMFLLYCL